jgi:hypothetical protein
MTTQSTKPGAEPSKNTNINYDCKFEEVTQWIFH